LAEAEREPGARKARVSGATAVAVGILASRLLGFLRVRAIGSFLGLGPHADVLNAALRAPNALQVLLGEGTLSASIIPVYTRLLDQGREREARRFAGAVLGLLAVVACALVLVGMLCARPLVALLTSGFLQDRAAIAAGTASVDRFELTVRAVRILFPMTGLLVLSVWCLAILNSHRRFLLSYAAPAVWNLAIVAALFGVARSFTGPAALDDLLFAACFGALVGGALQFLVQLPTTLRLLGGLSLSLDRKREGVGEALAAFLPLLAGRGVVQLGGYLDLFLASFLATGAVAALAPGQYLYMLPISLFGMSVAAAELPELSRVGGDGASPAFVERLRGALVQVSFVVLPTLVAYLAFGWLIVSLLYRSGRFGQEETWLVYGVLAAYSLGLPASTSSRLLQNAFYALRETKQPARVASQRVVLAAVLAAPLMLWLDGHALAEGLPIAASRGLRWGAVGLALASAVGAWYELWSLRRRLRTLLPALTWPARDVARQGLAALVAALPALAAWALLRASSLWVVAPTILGLFGLGYLALARALGVSQAERWLGRLARRRRSE
jgi:putative peptidoglycan lipid II flippase